MAMPGSGKGADPINFAERAAARARSPDRSAVRQNLEYMADMILEMRRLAARSGHVTLAELLDVAHGEAALLRDRS